MINIYYSIVISITFGIACYLIGRDIGCKFIIDKVNKELDQNK